MQDGVYLNEGGQQRPTHGPRKAPSPAPQQKYSDLLAKNLHDFSFSFPFMTESPAPSCFCCTSLLREQQYFMLFQMPTRYALDVFSLLPLIVAFLFHGEVLSQEKRTQNKKNSQSLTSENKATLKNDYWRDFKAEFSSPVTTEARNIVFWGGSSALLLASLLKDEVVDPVQENFVENKPLGKLNSPAEIFGRGLPNLLYSLSFWGASYFSTSTEKKKSNFEKSIRMLKVTGYSLAVTHTLKTIIPTRRPNGGTRSFPSGHTTSAFAFASVIATEHEWYWGALALAAATMTGLSRIQDEFHFLNDVVAGATIGMAFGYGLYYLELKSKKASTASKAQSRIFDDMLVLPTFKTRLGKPLGGFELVSTF